MRILLYILLTTPRQEKLFLVLAVSEKFAGTKGGAGKRGGVRVVYFNSAAEKTWLLTLYAKNERENIPAHELKKIKEAING